MSVSSPVSVSRASFTPGRDSSRLKNSFASGFGASHTEWAPTAVPVMQRKVEGPPHVGRREDLLKTNKELHKMLEGKAVECQHAERIIGELGASREKERALSEKERIRLAGEIAELVRVPRCTWCTRKRVPLPPTTCLCHPATRAHRLWRPLAE